MSANESRSANTLLLHVFRTLAAAERSFSVGDVVCEDLGLCEALAQSGSRVVFSYNLEWQESILRTPLANQCLCSACKTQSVPKCAIDFKLVGKKYILFRLKPVSSASLEGMMDALRCSLGGKAHAVRGCHNRSCEPGTYNFHAHDQETYALVCRDFVNAIQEHKEYNNHRLGNEFFIPKQMLRSVDGV
jgi:hypothetical protein